MTERQRERFNQILPCKYWKQLVSINGFDSGLRDFVCGVPPGSSLLFLIYINDFRLCLNKTESGHFADDTFILFGSKQIGTIESVVNHELKLVSKWLRLNKLSLNAKKLNLYFFNPNSTRWIMLMFRLNLMVSN